MGNIKKKRIIRIPKEARLLFGEGYTEAAFLKYIKSCFDIKNNVIYRIKHAYGGGPNSIIEKAKINFENGSFTQCLIVMDTDLDWPNERPTEEEGFFYVGSRPCIEGVLLRILGINSMYWSTKKCKHTFHKYIAEDKKCYYSNYEKFFPKELLEERRTEIEELDLLLKYYEI